MSGLQGLLRIALSAAVLAVVAAGPPGRWGAAVWEDELIAGRRVRVVEIDAEAGDLTLVVGPVLRARRAAPGWVSTLKLRHRLDDGRLDLDARCALPVACPVDHVVMVPEGTLARVRLGEGTVRAIGVADLDLQLSRGAAMVTDPQRLRLVVGTGSATIAARRPAQLDVLVAAGDIDAALPSDASDLGLVGRDVQLDGLEVRGVPSLRPALRLAAPGGAVRVVALVAADPTPPAPWTAPR